MKNKRARLILTVEYDAEQWSAIDQWAWEGFVNDWAATPEREIKVTSQVQDWVEDIILPQQGVTENEIVLDREWYKEALQAMIFVREFKDKLCGEDRKVV